MLLFTAVVGLISLHASFIHGAPTQRPGAPPLDSGSDKYAPSKCEWLALELNANYREAEAKAGYSSHFFCRPPGTIVLQYHLKSDNARDAALAAADATRESMGRVMRERNWRWVKIEEEILKEETSKPKAEPSLSVPREVGAAQD